MRLPTSVAAQLGTAIHASTSAFDAAALRGSRITPDEAAGAAVDAIHKPNADVAWDDEINPSSAEKIALSLHAKYCRGIAPEQNYIGVEVSCDRLEITDLGIALTGTTDRVRVTADGEIGIVDIKTGKNAVSSDGCVKTSGHMAQLAVYELLTSQALGRELSAPAQIIGMQTGKTEKAQRVACAPVVAPSLALIGTEDNPGLLEIAAGMLRKGLFYGNPRSQICSVKYCPAWKNCLWR